MELPSIHLPKADVLGALIHLGDEEIDKVVDRVLTSERVEQIARRVTEMLLDHLSEGLKARDKKEG